MRFLRKSDYYRLIQPNDLTTLLSTASQAGYDPDQLLIDSENAAIEMVKSYLSARYDLTRAFSDTPVFSTSTTYYATERVQYHETAYSTSSTYALNARVSYSGSIYRCTTAVTTPEAFDAAKWTFVCLDYALFYVTLPYAEFLPLTNYLSGAQVWWSDNYTYTALRNTKGEPLSAAVYSYYGADLENDPNQPAYKDDVSNTAVWSKSASKYSVLAGTLPTDATKWTAGDNRSQLLIEHIIDITLFNLYSTISPRNIPELRLIRFDGNDRHQNGGAMGWLKKVADGVVAAQLPEKYPIQGLPVVFSSGAPKNINFY